MSRGRLWKDTAGLGFWMKIGGNWFRDWKPDRSSSTCQVKELQIKTEDAIPGGTGAATGWFDGDAKGRVVG